VKIKIIIPSWPKDSFWDVLTFKFPALSTTLLAALTPEGHEVSIHDEGIAPLDFNEECDLVAITCMTPLAPRGYEIAEQYRHKGVTVVMGGIHPPGCRRRPSTTAMQWSSARQMRFGPRSCRMPCTGD
jgi:hypothetical protein